MLGCSSCHTLVCVCAHPWVIVRYLGVLPDRSVHTWYGNRTGPSPYLVSRVATPYDDTGEQARSVNLLETWGLVSRRGQRGNPLANGQYSSLGSQARGGQDRRFLPNSVRVLSQDKCIPLGYMGSLTTGSPTGSLSTFGESGLNVQSGHSEDLVFGSKVRAVLHRDWGH